MTERYDIQAVIFDVGGVLDRAADQTAEEADRRQLATELGVEPSEMWRAFFQTESWQLARVGQITDAEFWNRNLAPFGIIERADQGAFCDRLFAFKEVVPAMRHLLDELHGRVRLAIISNATDELETILDGFQVTHYFETIVNSARVGCAKPDPRIYQIALDRLKLRPGQTVFTDDQQRNLDAAGELGIHATLFTSVGDLRALLTELGVLGS